MIIRKKLDQQIKDLKECVVVTASDFDIPRQYRQALIKALSQYVKRGVLKRVSKGRYYKPKQTRFGELSPNTSEIIKDLLVKNGKRVGYVTGVEYFSLMGLTTQITSDIVIGTPEYHKPTIRNGHNISFVLQRNEIVREDFDLLRILDAVRMFREIPAATPNETVVQLGYTIKSLETAKRRRLAELARAYPPYVRALLGAILEQRKLPLYGLKDTLNPSTTYKLPISNSSLPVKKHWNIV